MGLPSFNVTNCSTKKIDTASAGAVAVGAAVAGKRCVLVGGMLLAGSAQAITFEDSDGADISGPMPFGANGGFAAPPNEIGWLASSSGKGLSINLGSAVQTSGWLLYKYVDG